MNNHYRSDEDDPDPLGEGLISTTTLIELAFFAAALCGIALWALI